MAYIFKRKLDLRELVDVPVAVKKIIIAEPEQYLCSIYSYHLSAANFFVKPCGDFSDLHRQLEDFNPHLLLVNGRIAGEFSSTARWLSQLRVHYPHLLIISVGKSCDSESVRHMMNAGVNAHLEPALTKPQDVVTIARSLFLNN